MSSTSYWDEVFNIVEIMQTRRQSTHELKIFKERWEKAVKEDENWEDPYAGEGWLDAFSTIKAPKKRSQS